MRIIDGAETRLIDGIEHKRVQIPCPDGIIGCAVCHYQWIPVEDHKKTFVFNVENKGQISDGYHTFDELYHHRMMLFSVICNTYKEKAWKSWKHHDGTMYDNYFIVGITTPQGDYTYHYHKDNWDKFDVKELRLAPEWDGHKPEDITRLTSLVVEKDYKTLAKGFIGETIKDYFCNGFFGSRNYDLEGAEIVKVYDSDDDNAIVIEVRKTDGRYDYGYFEDGWRDWQSVYEHFEVWTSRNSGE